MRLTKEEVKKIFCSIPVSEGGFPTWMFKDSIEPYIDLFEERLKRFDIKIIYEKDESK